MKLFQPAAKLQSPRASSIWAWYEIIYTIVDFGAALFFVVGSVMFFYESWLIPGTWMFLLGSILFAVKPSLRLAREVHLMRAGDPDEVARNLPAGLQMLRDEEEALMRAREGAGQGKSQGAGQSSGPNSGGA